MWIAIKLRIDCSAAAARRAWLKRLRRDHSDRIMPISERIAFQWGGSAAERPRGIADRLIAVTAMVHTKIIVTCDVGDISDTGIAVINPWDL